MEQLLFCILFGTCALIKSIANAENEGMSRIICSENISARQANAEMIDCPISPLLTMSAPCEGMTDVTEGVGLDHLAVHFRHVTNATMTCSGKNPVTIDILRPMFQQVDDAIYHRSTGNFSDRSTYCYKLEIIFKTLHTTTGDYICKEISEQNHVSSIYIMSDGENQGGLVLNSGKETHVTADDSGWIEFPCIVTNLNITPQLFFGDDEKSNLISNKQYKYTPAVGFRMKANSVRNRRSYCQLRDFGGEMFLVDNVNFLNGAVIFYKVVPEMSDLKGTEEMLQCESNYPISFHPEFTLKSNESTFSEDNESFYKYRITWKRNMSRRPIARFVIKCVLKLNNMSIHEWTFNGYLIYGRRGIAYVDNSTHPRIVCSSGSLTPYIAFIECSNPINCLIARNFSHLESFVVRNKQYSTRDCLIGGKDIVTCASVPYEEVKRNGILVCKYEDFFGPETLEKYYTITISAFTRILVDYAYLDTPTSLKTDDVLQLKFSKPNQTISVNENVYFECKASSFIFATGIHLRFMLVDNSFIGKDNPLVVVGRNWYSTEMEQDGIIVLNVSITMSSPNISKVYCFAPYWNIPGWANVSTSLHVAHPESVDSSIVKYNKDDKNKSIKCGDWASSNMRITWFKDGKELEREDYFRFADQRQSLLFEEVREQNAGTYVCTRGNSTGIWSKTFQFIVENEGGDYTIVAVLGICAVIMISALICIFLYLFRRGQHVLSKEEIKDFKQGIPNINNIGIDQDTLSEAFENTPYKEDSVEVPFKDFLISMDEVLGDGAFGIVYTAQVRGIKVAAKTVRDHTGKQELLSLLSELKLISCITGHQNVVGLIGAYTAKLHKEGKLFIFLEYCHGGSLYNTLRRYRQQCTACATRTIVITTQMLIDWSHQISVGMEYLAKNKIIHGDLATRNVLLAGNLIAKISDFGLSRKMYHYVQYHKSNSQEPLPWRWLAIETLEALVFSEKSDVWSYGITLWEIYSLANVPYPGLDWSADFVTKLKTGEVRLAKPEFADDHMYKLMKDCWMTSPHERPTFQSLKGQLFDLQATHKELGVKEVIPFLYKSDPADYTPLFV